MVKMSLEKLQLEADPGSIDYSDERYMTVQNLFKIENKINNLIDLVNSQQEAIEKLKEDIRPYIEDRIQASLKDGGNDE